MTDPQSNSIRIAPCTVTELHGQVFYAKQKDIPTYAAFEGARLDSVSVSAGYSNGNANNSVRIKKLENNILIILQRVLLLSVFR